ncbi:MAG: cache domain-containing protein [Candidatus Paceibacterota bacterium]|jgi:hypothetical protein|nr:hypothetical protein [Candidatus Paceibacterota bacterium]
MRLPDFLTRRHTLFAIFWDRKILFLNAIFLILFFILLLPALRSVVSFYDQNAVWRGSLLVEKGIENDKKNAEKHVSEIAKISDLATFIERRDVLNLLSVLQDEVQIRQLSGMIATGKDGVVIARTEMIADRGDYFFDIDAVGRQLAKEKETTSIEQLSAWPLEIESGRLIKKDGQLVGAIIATHSLDDRYAKALKHRYLPSDAEVIFYSAEKGVVASTFDPSLRQILAANFNTGTTWESWVNKGYIFSIGNTSYLVKDIPLNGAEEMTGKAIVFYPLHHTLVSVVSAVSAVLLFLLYFVFLRILRKKDLCKSFFFILALCSFIVFGVVFAATVFFLNQNVVALMKTPYTVYNSTLELEPSFGVFEMESEHRIAIRVVTGGEAINAVNVEMTYDPEKLEINDIITVNSFCDPELFLEKNIDKEKGKITIACGTKFPGYTGGVGTVAELRIQPLGEFETSLVFNEETQVLASDGLGTDVLRQTTGGNYQFLGSAKDPADRDGIIVFSPTHPNAERWYGKNSVRFIWKGEENAQYVCALNKSAFADFSGKIPTKHLEKTFSDLSDGAYFFHIAVQKEDGTIGPVTTKKIMIDLTPPEIPKILASENNVKSGHIVRVEFGSSDVLSGLQKNFYVKFNGGMFLPVSSPMLIAYPKGVHEIIVRAFDNAGNFSDGSISVRAY